MLNESRVILKSFIIVMPSFIYQKDNSCTYNWEGTSSLCLDHLEFVERWQFEAANLQNYYISFYAFIENNILQFHTHKTRCIISTILRLIFIVSRHITLTNYASSWDHFGIAFLFCFSHIKNIEM